MSLQQRRIAKPYAPMQFLFNVKADPSELQDVSLQHPNLVCLKGVREPAFIYLIRRHAPFESTDWMHRQVRIMQKKLDIYRAKNVPQQEAKFNQQFDPAFNAMTAFDTDLNPSRMTVASHVTSCAGPARSDLIPQHGRHGSRKYDSTAKIAVCAC